MNVIDTHELTKTYSSRVRSTVIVALDSVSVSVSQGEIVGLLGPNGAGKTTLVKCLLGLTRINSGSALLMGLPPDDPSSRAKVGYLPESPRFPDHLTGRELLTLTARMHGIPSADVANLIARLLAEVELERWADIRVNKFSKGMVQRIGLAQAMVMDPDLLILDEVTDGVDPVGRVEIRKILQKLRRQGKTILLNTHLLAEVESLADRVAILSRGKLMRSASVEELTSRTKQFEIVADIGDHRIEIPPEMGRRLGISRSKIIVELNNEEDVNYVIDQMRMKRILIRSLQPIKLSLEQSFLDVISEPETETASETEVPS